MTTVNLSSGLTYLKLLAQCLAHNNILSSPKRPESRSVVSHDCIHSAWYSAWQVDESEGIVPDWGLSVSVSARGCCMTNYPKT